MEQFQVIQPYTPGSVLALFDRCTSAQVAMFIDTICTEVEQGGRNALETEATAAILEKVAKGIRERVKKAAIVEAEKYPEKKIDVYGVQVEKCITYTGYDFSGNLKWMEMNAKIKEYEKFLKALAKPIEELDSETGELVKHHPPIKTQTEGIKISLK